MCGIWGWLGNQQQSLEGFDGRISPLLKHRGPDAQGFVYGSNWGLGFQRLSILDLSHGGNQPMCTSDGWYSIVFNGEIYNYVELRQALQAEGEVFYTTSDTEVLLRLLVRHGSDALEMLNGMFSLAFLDVRKATFLLARDRLGVKPLYYLQQNNQIRFASELKALLAWPDAPHSINETALVEYLATNYLPGSLCIFDGYQKLSPGHYLLGSLDAPERATPRAYWSININPDTNGGELSEAGLDDLGNLLQNAVQIRMRSDVPVGIFLSGGIDSGLVAALAGSTAGGLPLALTVGFDETAWDETLLAQATAQSIGLEHHIVSASPASLELVDTLAWYYDEPFGDSSALPSYLVCQAAKPYATVFLTGDGGDEAFAGYRRYIESRRLAWIRHLPFPVRATLQTLSHATPVFSNLRHQLIKTSLPDAGFAAWFDGMPHDPILGHIVHSDLRHLASHAGQPAWSLWRTYCARDLTSRQQSLDYAIYLPDDILVKMDRASMAHSIEARSPFLDYRVVEWAARQPRQNLINRQQGKLPLRRLARRFLPAVVQNGRKRGFGVPLDSWFRMSQNLNFVRERLLSPEARNRHWWDVSKVERMIRLHVEQNNRPLGAWLWRLLMLDAWARYYVDNLSFMERAMIKR